MKQLAVLPLVVILSCINSLHGVFASDTKELVVDSRANKNEVQHSTVVKIDTSNHYSINATIGGQDFTLRIDTTTANIWVYNSTVKLCPGDDNDDDDGQKFTKNCAFGSRFNISKSKTFRPLDHQYNATSPDGSYALGRYAVDTLDLNGGVKLSNFTFGLVNTTTKAFSPGVFGIGFTGTAGLDPNWNYKNFMVTMIEEKAMDSAIISMWADDNGGGELLFGGIDIAKYKDGPLTMIPVTPVASAGDMYPFIQLSGVRVENEKGSSENITKDNYDLPVLLNAGSLMSRLPYEDIVSIALQMNSFYAEDLNMWIQSCEYQNILNGSVVLNFYDVEIKVPVKELLLPMTDFNNGLPKTFANGDPVCALAFRPSEEVGYSTIGAPILKNMYTVFNVESSPYQIAIAQADRSAKQQRIVNIEAGPNAQKSDFASYVSSLSLTAVPTVTMSTPSGKFTSHNNQNPKIMISNGEFITSGLGTGAGKTQLPTADNPLPRASKASSTGRTMYSAATTNKRTNNPLLAFLTLTIITILTN